MVRERRHGQRRPATGGAALDSVAGRLRDHALPFPGDRDLTGRHACDRVQFRALLDHDLENKIQIGTSIDHLH